MRTGLSRKRIVALNYPLRIEVACRAVSLIPSDKFVEWLPRAPQPTAASESVLRSAARKNSD